MADMFERALPLLLKHEGGYVDHPRDPGGATNFGVTRATLAAWRGRPVTKAEVKALTPAEAGRIYRANYWLKSGCEALPPGLDYAHFDAAVNSGPGRAAKWLRATAWESDPVARARAYCRARLAFLQALNNWGAFGKGWARRVAEVEAVAVAWAMRSAGHSTGAVAAAAKKEAAKAGHAASANKAAAGAVPATAGGSVVASPEAAAGLPGWAIAVLAAAIVAAIAVFALRAHIARERQNAYAKQGAAA